MEFKLICLSRTNSKVEERSFKRGSTLRHSYKLGILSMNTTNPSSPLAYKSIPVEIRNIPSYALQLSENYKNVYFKRV